MLVFCSDMFDVKPIMTRKLRRRPNDPMPLPAEKRRKTSPDILDQRLYDLLNSVCVCACVYMHIYIYIHVLLCFVVSLFCSMTKDLKRQQCPKMLICRLCCIGLILLHCTDIVTLCCYCPFYLSVLPVVGIVWMQVRINFSG